MAGKHSKKRTNIKLNKRLSRQAARKKQRKKNIIFFFVFLILISLLLYSLINIYNWYKDSKAVKEEMADINEIVTITETAKEENTEIIESKEEKSSPYWDYIKMNLIDVDFRELKKVNSDVKGWIQVNGTNINYPFVQTN